MHGYFSRAVTEMIYDLIDIKKEEKEIEKRRVSLSLFFFISSLFKYIYCFFFSIYMLPLKFFRIRSMEIFL